MVHSQGGIVHFLPPYSPDLMLIELAFNFVKNWLGRYRSNAEQNSKLAVVKALQAISSIDAENFLATCGFFLGIFGSITIVNLGIIIYGPTRRLKIHERSMLICLFGV